MLTESQNKNHLRRRYHQHLDRVAMTIEQGTKPVVSTIESAMVNVLNQRQNTEIDEIHAKMQLLRPSCVPKLKT